MEDNIIELYSDESGWDGDNRFGSICVVSGTSNNITSFNKIVSKILKANNKDEIKLNGIKNTRHITIVKQILDSTIIQLLNNNIKISVIVWDKHDKRHNVKKRCDRNNLMRMYYHIMNDSIKQWKNSSEFNFYPDEFSGVNWIEELTEFLQNRKINQPQNLFDVIVPKHNKIKETLEFSSKTSCMIQVCDLIAGIIRMSRENVKEYRHWINLENNQLSLFDDTENITVSNSKKVKFQCLKYFHDTSIRSKLGISYNTNNYFCKYNKDKNLFIWHYTPQHDLDKAPVKS